MWFILCILCLCTACKDTYKTQLEQRDEANTEMAVDLIDQVIAEEDFIQTEVGKTSLRRLTFEQIKHSLQDVLGSDLLIPEVAEPEVVQNGLIALGASIASFSSRGVNSIEQMAYKVAEQAMDEPGAREQQGGSPR